MLENTTIYPLIRTSECQIRSKIIDLVWKHFGYNDSQGIPYAFHKFRVGERAYHLALLYTGREKFAEEVELVGFCHDFIEDIPEFQEEPQMLVKEGLPEHLLSHVLSVTIKKGEHYRNAIERAKNDDIGRFVKMADLTDNSTLARLSIQEGLSKFINPIEKGLNRQMKYFLSYVYLVGQINKEEYLSQMEKWNLN